MVDRLAYILTYISLKENKNLLKNKFVEVHWCSRYSKKHESGGDERIMTGEVVGGALFY